MNIGILTFHYAHNYGAVLQAYALKTYLSKLGNTVTIINYNNKTISSKYQKRIRKKIHINDIRSKCDLRHYIRQCYDLKIEQPSWNLQYNKFQSFIKEYLLAENSKPVNKSQISLLNYDLMISGSDQLWNQYLTDGYDDVYFLNFDTSARKAFYAISNGQSYVTQKNYDYYVKVLRSIKYISTREKSLACDIKKSIGVQAYSAADPSFLLRKEDYVTNFKLKKNRKILFAYYIVEDNFMANVVRVIASALNLDIVELHYYKKRFLKEKYQHADIGPVDFLNCIYNAEFVITNSFHGTAFSLIFNKQFYCVYKNDARKDNLLDNLCLQRRKIKCADDLDLNDKIDYSMISLDKYVEPSKKYLDAVINNSDLVVE